MYDIVQFDYQCLAVCLIVFNEVSGYFSCHTIDVRHFISEEDTIEFVGMLEQFRSESGCDELCIFAEFMDHIGNGFPVLCIESLKIE